MNIFRLTGDALHTLAILILLQKIWRTKSCSGISGKTQILLALVYLTRYLDVFTTFISYYNSIMKIYFFVSSISILYCIYVKYKDTNERESDRFRIALLIIPCAVLALCIHYELTIIEVMWTFSIFLESVAMLPQFLLTKNDGKPDKTIMSYIIVFGAYRAFYIFNWIYRYYDQGHYDAESICGGLIQTIIFCDFFLFQIACTKNRQMNQYLNCRIRVILQDSRTFCGIFKGSDEHKNLILEDAEELCKIPPSNAEKPIEREEILYVGRVLLRSENIRSVALDQEIRLENGVLSVVPAPARSGGDHQPNMTNEDPPPSYFQITIQSMDGEGEKPKSAAEAEKVAILQ